VELFECRHPPFVGLPSLFSVLEEDELGIYNAEIEEQRWVSVTWDANTCSVTGWFANQRQLAEVHEKNATPKNFTAL
jgi:hypothetical protein